MTRHRHPVRWIVLGTVLLVAADLAAWLAVLAWRLAFVLVPAVVAVAWWRHRRARPPRMRGTVLRGQVLEVGAEDGHEARP